MQWLIPTAHLRNKSFNTLACIFRYDFYHLNNSKPIAIRFRIHFLHLIHASKQLQMFEAFREFHAPAVTTGSSCCCTRCRHFEINELLSNWLNRMLFWFFFRPMLDVMANSNSVYMINVRRIHLKEKRNAEKIAAATARVCNGLRCFT